MRRWARFRHGLDLPHYAVSIVRGRGIDANALRWLADRHDPADVVFVDGWTGKGAITRELAAALRDFEATDGVTGFDPEIAVLADPGSCVRTYGTRDDFLIPSACLNSTVSGLISRTVLRADLVGRTTSTARSSTANSPEPTCPRPSSTPSPPASRTSWTPSTPRPRTSWPPTAPPPGRAGPPSSASARNTASTTSTSSSPASARPPG